MAFACMGRLGTGGVCFLRVEVRNSSCSRCLPVIRERQPKMSKTHLVICAVLISLINKTQLRAANVPQGSPEEAKRYYRSLATTIGFRDPDSIFTSTLDDVTAYMGYPGLTTRDLQRLESHALMDS